MTQQAQRKLLQVKFKIRSALSSLPVGVVRGAMWREVLMLAEETGLSADGFERVSCAIFSPMDEDAKYLIVTLSHPDAPVIE